MSTAKKIAHTDVIEIYQQAIENSVIENIKSMTGLNAVLGPCEGHFIKDVTGLIGMPQSKVEGLLGLSFSKEAIFTILNKIYGKDFNEIDNTVVQGVGELTNVIYGRAKQFLNDELGIIYQRSLPTVVIGDDHFIESLMAPRRNLDLCFKIDGEHFFGVHIMLNMAPMSLDEFTDQYGGGRCGS